MDNILSQLLASGDRVAVNNYLNNYLRDKTITGDANGINVDNQGQNQLAALVNPQQNLLPRRSLGFSGDGGQMLDEVINQPQNRVINPNAVAESKLHNMIKNNTTGEYVTLGGGSSSTPTEFDPDWQRKREIENQNVMAYNAALAQKQAEEAQQQKILANLPQYKALADLQHIQAQTRDTLAQAKQRELPPTDQWEHISTSDGAIVQVNKRTGEIRNLGITSASTKAPPGYRYTTDGSLEPIPGGPADDKSKLKSQGAEDVGMAISTLRDAYDRLEKGGGITSTKAGALSNISAASGSSALGQGLGKMLGTENQSARNDIAMTRPALLASLMKATGMSAKQMDSNAELKLWLATATDPTLDVESNRRALAKIEEKYLGRQNTTQPRGATGDFSTPQVNSSAMNTMPPASKHAGRLIQDDAGNKYKSDGSRWIRM